MKKITMFFLAIMIIVGSQSFTYADDGGASSENANWVKDAVSATDSFLKEKTVDTIGISKVFSLFQSLVKGVNRILIVLLAGISIIALAVTGIKYIAESNPTAKGEAKKSLKTIFIGMIIGFGAFTIWKIAMSIVDIIMGAFSQ